MPKYKRVATLGIMEKSASLDLSYYDNPEMYNEVGIVKKDIAFLQDLVWRTSFVIEALLGLFSNMILLMRLNWVFPFLVIIVSIPNVLFERKFKKMTYLNENMKMIEERKCKYLYKMFFDRNFCKEIRLNQQQKYLIEKYEKIKDSCIGERYRLVKKRGSVTLGSTVISLFGFICMQFYAGLMVIKESLTLGDYTLYTGLVSNSLNYTEKLLDAATEIYDSDIRIKHHVKFMELKENEVEYGNCPIFEIEKIEFKNVYFKYPNTKEYVLENINFIMNANEKIAFVGLNGAGKTTLAKILLGFYEPTKGEVLINGLNRKEYNIHQLKKIFSAVFQDYGKYSFPVMEAVGMSDVNKIENSEKVMEACRKSGADDFISRWKRGYETYLTKTFDDEGEELSGGQWQKIALASAFFRDAKVLVLDEPTASLDPKAEFEIFEKFSELTVDKCAVLISHRLSSVVAVDRIYVLENRTIIEQGNHHELMEKKGRYHRLFSLQAQKYIQE